MNNTTDFKDLVEFVNNSSMSNKLKKKRQKRIILFASNLIAISCLVAGGFGIKTILDNKRDYEEAVEKQKMMMNLPFSKRNLPNDEDGEEAEDAISTYSLEEYVSKNNDTVGYLYVPGTDINIITVQTDNNDYYLNHDFDGNWNSMGWIFADYRNSFPDFSRNTIIYGHTYKDTIMFSSLKNVLTNDWQNNPDNFIITFNSVNHEYKWQIFSVYTIDVTSDYLDVDFNSDSEFLKFANKLKNRSDINFNVGIESDDKILTLSTCYISSNYRLVVHAKLIK